MNNSLKNLNIENLYEYFDERGSVDQILKVKTQTTIKYVSEDLFEYRQITMVEGDVVKDYNQNVRLVKYYEAFQIAEFENNIYLKVDEKKLSTKPYVLTFQKENPDGFTAFDDSVFYKLLEIFLPVLNEAYSGISKKINLDMEMQWKETKNGSYTHLRGVLGNAKDSHFQARINKNVIEDIYVVILTAKGLPIFNNAEIIFKHHQTDNYLRLKIESSLENQLKIFDYLLDWKLIECS